jgi:uncharacterized protein (TIRG00374 family)
MAQAVSGFHPNRRYILLLAVIAAALYVLLPQVGAFRSSWQLLRHPDAGYTALAVALTFGTYAAGSGTYCLLAFKGLRYWRTVLVQLAAMFLNRLVPAGIGALGANYLYLRGQKHSASRAVAVVGINNLLGLTGHWIVVGVTLALFPGDARLDTSRIMVDSDLLIKGLLVVLVAVIAAGLVFGRKKAAKALRDIKTQLISYRRRPLRLAAAQCTSILLTLCNVLCLTACLYALGIQLPFAAVLVVFTFGVSAGAAVPTPGGLGGFEAGLAAGFIAYGIDSSAALAAALLYRLISYWLPMTVGLAAFIVCQKRGLFPIRA